MVCVKLAHRAEDTAAVDSRAIQLTDADGDFLKREAAQFLADIREWGNAFLLGFE